MLRCLPVRVRHFSSALILSIPTVFSADALADPGNYRVHGETRSNGVRIMQHVDLTTFPQFRGFLLSSSSPDTPPVSEVLQARAVRALVPLDGQRPLVIATEGNEAHIAVDIYARHVRVSYHGPAMSAAENPFVEASGLMNWDYNRWQQLIPTDGRLSDKTTHILVTLYVIPRVGLEPPPRGKGNLLVSVTEATVQGMNVVSGRVLVNKAALAVGERNWFLWRQLPLRAGLVARKDSTEPNPISARTRRPVFVEQRTLDLRDEGGSHRRDKRCVTDLVYYMSNFLVPAFLEVYFSRPDLCSFDPHPDGAIAAPLPLVEVTDPQDVPRIQPLPEPIVFEASAADPETLGHTDAYDAAMAIQFCNANNRSGEGDEPCTSEDRWASAAIGGLTPLQVDDLLARIARTYDPNQPGPAAIRTGNDRLDRWINADLRRAEQALQAMQQIVRLSEAATERTKPIKKRKRNKVVKASCATKRSSSEAAGTDEGFQCVTKAMKKLGDDSATVAVNPHVEDDETFHLRGTVEFTQLAREFVNLGGSLPPGLSEADFAKFTTAIARDPAAAGNNLGIIYINDPALRGNDRFRYGIEHIWAPGAGGGPNAGHREDWAGLRGLPVNREMLTPLIMAALTDPSAEFTQQRNRTGNLVRTFRRFRFRHGQNLYTITNVRIVLGQNGMVITAFPLTGASATSLAM